MKRRLCLLFVLGSCFLAASSPAQYDERSWKEAGGTVKPAHAVETPPPPIAVARKADLVEELIDVLDKTQSVDAFLVTLKLLEKFGARSTTAIPAIIRNAERLGLFKDHLPQKNRDSELVNDIAKSLEQIRQETPEPPMIRPAAWRENVPLTAPPILCKLHPKDGQRAIEIVLDCSVADRVVDDLGLVRADDVAYRLRKQIEARFAEEAIEVRVVPVRQVEKVRAEKTIEFGPDALELARHFKADYAVCLYIRSGHLIQKTAGDSSTGGINVLLQVLDARTPEDDPVHEEEMDLEQTANAREMGPFLRELIDRTTREAVSRLKVQ